MDIGGAYRFAAIGAILFVTFRVRHIAEAKCILVTAVCMHVCVCLSLAAFPHYCTDPDVTWRNYRSAL